MKAQFVYERLDFERGKDPKRALDIGMPEIEILNKIQPFLDKYNFREERGPFPSESYKSDYKVIRVWSRHHRTIGIPKGAFQFMKLVFDEDENKYFLHPDNGVDVNSSKDYDIDNWYENKTWKRYFNQPVLNQRERFNIYRHYESQN